MKKIQAWSLTLVFIAMAEVKKKPMEIVGMSV